MTPVGITPPARPAVSRSTARNSGSGDANGDARFVEMVRRGIQRGEFQVVYQPKIDARTLEVTGAECLLRWRRAVTLGMNTQDVVRKAEQTGCIEELTQCVLGHVGEMFRRLDERQEGLKISINISSILLGDRCLADYISKVARGYAHRTVLEVTETAIFECQETAVANLRALSEAGFMLSLDDFGTGYSSLAQLQHLPLNELKIDRGFVKDLTNSHRGPLLVRSTIDLAHALEYNVVAEGVEDAETMALLAVMGCDELQGFFIAKPMRADDFLQWLDREDHEFRTVSAFPSLLKSV